MSQPEIRGDPSQPIEAIMLTGPGLETLNADRLSMLRQLAGGIGLEMTILADATKLTKHEPHTEPVPVGLQDFLSFAASNGYTSRRAHSAWRAVASTARETKPRQFIETEDPYSPLRILYPPNPESVTNDRLVIDLRSVHQRLRQSESSHAAWHGLTERQTATMDFLARLITNRLSIESS